MGIGLCLCLLYLCSLCSFNYFDLLSFRNSWPASPCVSCPVFHLCFYLSFFFTLYWFHCYFIFHYCLIWADPEWPVFAAVNWLTSVCTSKHVATVTLLHVKPTCPHSPITQSFSLYCSKVIMASEYREIQVLASNLQILGRLFGYLMHTL